MKTILIVEDDKDIIDLLVFTLESNGYNTVEANNGRQALEMFKSNAIDLIITDVMMPEVDGYELVTNVRKLDLRIPIIMLTALKSEGDELKGFNTGVTDYVSKPFSIQILLKRIENQLSLAAIDPNPAPESTKLIDDNLIVDLERFSISVNDQEVMLTKKEYKLLVMLMENSGIVVTRDKLIKLLWGENYYGDTRNIDTHIKNIRKKIANDRIKTVKGIGYMYEKQK